MLHHSDLFQGRPGLNGLRGVKGDRGEAFNVSSYILVCARKIGTCTTTADYNISSASETGWKR